MLRTPVLLSLALLFSAASCITMDKSVGSGLVPDNQELQVFSADFPIPFGLKMADSLQSVSSGTALVGAFWTDRFGTVRFDAAGNITPSSTETEFGKDPVIKSIYLSVQTSGVNVMEESQAPIPQDFFVYRTKRVVDTTTLYNNSFSPEDIESEPVQTGTATFFGGDSLKIYLKNSFGQELLSATDEELDSLERFAERFKGLYLRVNPPEAGANGGRLNLINLTTTTLVLNYTFQPEWQEGLPRKDTSVALSFGITPYALNLSSYESKHLETDDARGMKTLPVEGAAGIKPYIDIRILRDTLDHWIARNGYDPRKILIIKASYTLPFDPPADYNQFIQLPSALYPAARYRLNGIETNPLYYYLLSDINSTDNNTGLINRSVFTYSGDFSAVMQSIVSGRQSEEANSFWFLPTISSQNSTTGSTSYNINSSYYTGWINGPAADRQPKITLLYTVLP